MRVLVLGAGGPAGVNTCKALSAHEVVAVDENPEHLVWCEPYVAGWRAMREPNVEYLNELEADVIIPQPDKLTLWTADHADQLTAKTFLPDRRTIALCQDKFMCGLEWRRAGLREDRIELIDSPDAYLTMNPPLWIRARHGAGAKAAILARNSREAYHWINFWYERDPRMDLIAEGYLPGRDFAWSGIYYRGELVTSFARERLEYLYPGLTPEGLTGTPTRARIVHDIDVNATAEEAVFAVDKEPHGIFSVDLKEDEEGLPRPTEINAGRGFTTFGLWAEHTRWLDLNLLNMVVVLAVDEDLDFGLVPGGPLRDVITEGLTLYRHIDCGSFFKAAVPA